MQKEIDPIESACRARLVYVSDETPGYRRRRCGKGFTYFDPQGRRVADPALKARFKQLAIPPAWENVWISHCHDGHIQATGRDARGRKQYLYHPRWEEIRSLTKFDRMIAFGEVLPQIRKQISRHLKHAALSRETALAFAVRLLDETLFRAGNPEYVQRNRSFGLTTLRDYHVAVSGAQINLHFRGKGGKSLQTDIRDRRIAHLARKYQELPGQELLKYENGSGELKAIDSGDVNAYLREISGQDFTAKDFRTWGGTVCAALALYRLKPAATQKECKRKILKAMRRTAAKLGNTPATCRKYYVHPVVIQNFEDQSIFDLMPAYLQRPDPDDSHFGSLEEGVLMLLKRTSTTG